MEWAIIYPERVKNLLLLSCSAVSSAEQLAWSATQVQAIVNDAAWLDGRYLEHPESTGPAAGLGLARRIAHITYRSPQELQDRFAADHQTAEHPWYGGRYAVESYLDHQAAKLVERFDPASYVTLVRAMSSHDVGRGRGGLAAALGRIQARTIVAGVDTDRLFPLAEQQQLAELIPGTAPARVIHSANGHDGFLTEIEQVGKLCQDLLPAIGSSGAAIPA